MDSRIVQDMIKKSSYGFNTFAGLRVGEIQNKSDVNSWLYIPSEENLADVLTKGVPPSEIGPDSVWQTGPAWLTKYKSKWPVSVVEDAHEKSLTKESMMKFLKKEKQLGSKQNQEYQLGYTYGTTTKTCKIQIPYKMEETGVDDLIRRCGNLPKLIRSIAYVLRLGGRAPKQDLVEKREAMVTFKEISASEFSETLNVLVSY